MRQSDTVLDARFKVLRALAAQGGPAGPTGATGPAGATGPPAPLVRGTAVNTAATGISTAPVLVLAANPARIQALFVNNGPSGAPIVYLGQAGVTTTTGLPINAQGGALVDDASKSAWYAVVGSGGASGSLVVCEVS